MSNFREYLHTYYMYDSKDIMCVVLYCFGEEYYNFVIHPHYLNHYHSRIQHWFAEWFWDIFLNLCNVFLLCSSFNSKNCSINFIAFSVKYVITILLHMYSFLGHVHPSFLVILVMRSMLRFYCTNLFLDMHHRLKHLAFLLLYRISIPFINSSWSCSIRISWYGNLRCNHFMFHHFTFQHKIPTFVIMF